MQKTQKNSKKLKKSLKNGSRRPKTKQFFESSRGVKNRLLGSHFLRGKFVPIHTVFKETRVLDPPHPPSRPKKYPPRGVENRLLDQKSTFCQKYKKVSKMGICDQYFNNYWNISNLEHIENRPQNQISPGIAQAVCSDKF